MTDVSAGARLCEDQCAPERLLLIRRWTRASAQLRQHFAPQEHPPGFVRGPAALEELHFLRCVGLDR